MVLCMRMICLHRSVSSNVLEPAAEMWLLGEGKKTQGNYSSPVCCSSQFNASDTGPRPVLSRISYDQRRVEWRVTRVAET